MKAKNARALGVWHPPTPAQEDWVRVTVALRPHEYERLLALADAYAVPEGDMARAAILQLLRNAAKQAKTVFDRAERR